MFRTNHTSTTKLANTARSDMILIRLTQLLDLLRKEHDELEGVHTENTRSVLRQIALTAAVIDYRIGRPRAHKR